MKTFIQEKGEFTLCGENVECLMLRIIPSWKLAAVLSWDVLKNSCSDSHSNNEKPKSYAKVSEWKIFKTFFSFFNTAIIIIIAIAIAFAFSFAFAIILFHIFIW